MKSPQQSQRNLSLRINWSRFFLLSGLLAAAGAVHASDIYKADVPDSLNLTTSWTNGVVPTASDIAVWDSTVVNNAATAFPGGPLSWLGIRIQDPAAAVTIPADGNTLTNGAAGIDMSAASQALSIACDLALDTTQSWNVAALRTLTVSGKISGNAVNAALVKTGAGTNILSFAGSTYNGGTTISNGLLVIGTIGTGHVGSNSVTIKTGGTFVLFSGNSGDPGGGGGSYSNAIFIPVGETGTIWNSWRCGAATGNNAPVSGGGILNFRVNGVRGEVSGNWSGFTNQVNVTTRTGNDDFRIAIGGATNAGFANLRMNLAAGVNMYQSVNPPNGGVTASTTFHLIGELSGVAGSTLNGQPVAGRFVNWTVGALNTDATFAGTIRDGNVSGAGGGGGAARITKIGTGAWTLTANETYSGSTLVAGGKLVGVTGGSISNSASITVNSGAAMGVFVAPATSGQWVGTNMIFTTNSALEVNYAGSSPSTTVAPLQVRGNVTFSNTVSVRILGGNWAVGVYPLVKYSSITNGAGFAALSLTSLPARVLGVLSNDTANNLIDLVVTNTTQPLFWSTGSANWDINTTANWKDSALAGTTYQEANGFGDSVLFEDTQSVGTPIVVTLNTNVIPVSAAVSSSKTYTISGTGSISGVGSVTKQGSGTLVLATTNTFTGGANLLGGVLSFSTLQNLGASSSPIAFGGGTLQFASGNTSDISVRTVTLGAGDGRIDTLANNVAFANAIGNNGAGGLIKTGSGTLTLSGANRYSGNTTINQGSVTLAAGASISNSAAVIVASGTSLDASASGITLNGANNQILAGSGTVLGAVAALGNASISPGTNGTAATLTFNSTVIVNGGTLVMDVSTNVSGRDRITIAGPLILTSGNLQLIPSTVLTNGTYPLITAAGGLVGSAGALLLTGFSQSGQIAFLSDATPGQVDLVVATAGTNNLTWQGNGNTWDVATSSDWFDATLASSVFNQGDSVTFNDTGAANPNLLLTAPIYPTRVSVSGTTSYSWFEGSGVGAGKLIGPTGVTNSGSGTLTVLTINNNTGPTVIGSSAVIQYGSFAAAGLPGPGNITNNGGVSFTEPDDRTVNSAIIGSGNFTNSGVGVLTLAKNNTYSGATAIAVGSTLQVGSGGAVGTLGTGSVFDDGTLIFNRSGTFTNTTTISGAGTLIKMGSSTLTLGGANTYQGNTFISNGVVKLAASEVIPDGGATTGWLILDGGATAGTLDLNGFNETVNGLAGLGGAVLGQIANNTGTATNTLTVNGVASTAFAGLIRDNTGTGGRVRLVVNEGINTLTLSGANGYSGGTWVLGGTLAIQGGGASSGDITVSNATINELGSGVTFLGNTIRTPSNSVASFTAANLNSGYGGLFVSEDSTSTNDIIGGISVSTPNVRQFTNFSGTVVVEPTTGQIRFSSTSLSVNGGDNTTFVVNGLINTRNGMPGNGGGISLGALFGTGTISGGSAAGSSLSTYIIGGKGNDSIFSGNITGIFDTVGNNNVSVAIVKSGGGRLTLDGTLNYDGATIVSNGVLAIASLSNPSTSLDVSPVIAVRSGGSLDMSQRSDATLNLGNVTSQTLSGSGTVLGSVLEAGGSTINPGDTIGKLTVTNVATILGTVLMELNRTSSPATNDMLSAGTFAISGATLTVTNVGPTLLTGDSFKLFNQPVSGFATVNLPATDVSGNLVYNWTNKLAIDGSIQLLSGGLNLNPTNITLTQVSPTQVNLSWPADHTGWRLQAQTNALTVGLSNNWSIVANATATNQVTVTIAQTNACVFYRLVYP